MIINKNGVEIGFGIIDEDKKVLFQAIQRLKHFTKTSGYFRTNLHVCVHDIVINPELLDAFIGFLIQFKIHRKKGVVDHINNNREDNRLKNLRYCTVSQNTCNRRKETKKQRSSKYIGVSFIKKNIYFRKNKWCAFIVSNKKRYTKNFETEIEAAKWRDLMAMKLHGEFASLNFQEILKNA